MFWSWEAQHGYFHRQSESVLLKYPYIHTPLGGFDLFYTAHLVSVNIVFKIIKIYRCRVIFVVVPNSTSMFAYSMRQGLGGFANIRPQEQVIT